MHQKTGRQLRLETLEVRELLSADRQLFDFGNGPLINDDDAVAVSTEIYDAERGYGWLANNRLTLRFRPGMADELLNDSVLGLGRGESVFRIDVPAGEYNLRIILGDPMFPRDSMQVSADGQLIGEMTTTSNNLFAELAQITSVDDTIEIAFDDVAGDLFWSLAAIELMRVPAPPEPLAATPPRLLGDYNLDEIVDSIDYSVWGDTLGNIVPAYTAADGSGNGRIDQADYDVWKDHFGQSLPVVHPTPHGEPIPDFAASPTIAALASGDWSDPAAWDAGHVPSQADIVAIPEGVELTIHDTSAVADRIVVHGTLRFATDVDTQLRVSTLHVKEHGTLEIGTEDAPVTAKAQVIVRDTPIDFQNDPEQYGTGLLVEGTIRVHGLEKTSFERLATEPLAGATELVFTAPVDGWMPGDRLFLPDTRQLVPGINNGSNYIPQAEYVEVIAVSGDTVTLNRPLTFNHFGARDGDGVLTILPHAANLTRNVSIASENPSGVRGHTLYTERADVDIRYAEFNDLGRTTADPLNSTTFNPNGTVKQIGSNQIGRYAMHLHHLDGPEQPQANGYQYTLVGTAINGGAELHKFKWGITIHDSHYGLVQDNVAVNWTGAGLLFEEGNETGNVIDHNFVGRVWSAKTLREDSDSQTVGGVGIWIRGVNSYVRNNVVTNVFGAGQAVGITITNFANPNGTSIPASQGSQVDKKVDFYQLPLLEFANNEVYGTLRIGLTYWNIGAYHSSISKYNDGSPESWIRNFTAWHYHRTGVLGYPSEKVNFDGLTLFADYSQFRTSSIGPIGVSGGDYAQPGRKIVHANIQNNAIGVSFSTVTFGQPQWLRDSYLRNTINVSVGTLVWGSGKPAQLQPRLVYIDNVVFATPNVPTLNRTWYNIKMSYGGNGPNYILPDAIYVTNYNGVQGDNFRVYYYEQRPGFIVPQTNLVFSPLLRKNILIGSPDAGLTNLQNWELYGIAIAGGIVPESAVERDGIYGLVSPNP